MNPMLHGVRKSRIPLDQAVVHSVFFLVFFGKTMPGITNNFVIVRYKHPTS